MKCLTKNDTVISKVKHETTMQVIETMLIFFATYLGDKRGWKPERITEALKWIHKMAEMVLEDYVTVESAKYALVNDYGVLIEDGHVYTLTTQGREDWLKSHVEPDY